MTLPVDVAVVRVVPPHSTLTTQKIVLPVREDRLSLENFTFFAAMAKVYNASGEIYSVTVTSKKKKANLDFRDTKRILRKIDDKLSRYTKLANHIDIALCIKHSITLNEIDQVLHHLSHTDFNLMIVDGQRLPASSCGS